MIKRIKGFTLLELMIVVAIISILTVTLIPSFVKIKNQARLTACTSNLKNLSTIIENYAIDNRDLYPKDEFLINEDEPKIQGYYNQKLTCPVGKKEYRYIPDTTNNSYWIYCPTYNDNNKHKTSRGVIQIVYFYPKIGISKKY